MVSGLFDDGFAGVFSLQRDAGCDEAVAGCAALRPPHVFPIDWHESNEALHRLPLDRVFVLAATVLSVNGVLHKRHVPTEAGANAFRILLVADPTTDAI